MKKTKFKLPIFISILLLGLGCFFVGRKNGHCDFFKDILSRYPEENIAVNLIVDLTHDGNDDLLVISQDALEITLEIYTITDGKPVVIYKDSASDNHAGWRWYYLTVVDDKDYILQYTPEIWNGIGNYHLEVFSFDQKGQKEILETQKLPYDSIHISEDKKLDLLNKTENFKVIYEKWLACSTPLITIGSDPFTGHSVNYILKEKLPNTD